MVVSRAATELTLILIALPQLAVVVDHQNVVVIPAQLLEVLVAVVGTELDLMPVVQHHQPVKVLPVEQEQQPIFLVVVEVVLQEPEKLPMVMK